METIYDFNDEMMLAHNALKDARDKFAEVVERDSRAKNLTERHRGRWIQRVHEIESVSPIMVKDGNVEEDEPAIDGNALTETDLIPKDMSWQQLQRAAKSANINIHKLKRPEIESLLSAPKISVEA